jgi:hypothetical protein
MLFISCDLGLLKTQGYVKFVSQFAINYQCLYAGSYQPKKKVVYFVKWDNLTFKIQSTELVWEQNVLKWLIDR